MLFLSGKQGKSFICNMINPSLMLIHKDRFITDCISFIHDGDFSEMLNGIYESIEDVYNIVNLHPSNKNKIIIIYTNQETIGDITEKYVDILRKIEKESGCSQLIVSCHVNQLW